MSEPMRTDRIAFLRSELIRSGAKFYAFEIAECLAEIERQRAVIAERDAEIERRGTGTNHQAFLKRALETARHELASSHGLWATDRPELFDAEKFQLDYSRSIRLLDEAIAAIERREDR